MDRTFFDWLTANTRAAPPSATLPSVTLVEIDQSVADTPGRLPLPPLEYALFLQAVVKYDPAVVAIEPVLDWSPARGSGSPPEAGGEQILLNQAIRVPKLLLGFRLGNAESGFARDPNAIPFLSGVRGSLGGLTEFPDVTASPGTRLLPLAASGATNLAQGRDGATVRDLPLVFRCRDRVLPSFALQTLALGLQIAPSEVTVEVGSHVQLGERLRVPIDRAGRALLDARAFSRFQRIGLDDLMLLDSGQNLPDTARALGVAARMRGGIVILGRTDAAAKTLRVPGVESVVSPAEVLAWSVGSLEEAPPTRRASVWWDAGIIAGAALLAMVLSRRGRWTVAGLTVIGLAAYGLGALSIFGMFRLWLPLALPLGLLVAVLVLGWLPPSSTEIKDKP